MSLRIKLALLALLLATLPLAGIGVLALRVNAETLVNGQRELQIALLEDLARTLDAELRDAELGLDTSARVLSDATLAGDARIALAEADVEARTSLDHVAVYDREGGLIDVIREQGVDTSTLPEQLDADLRDAAARVRVATGPATHEPAAARVLLVVAIRPEGPQGPITGYVASRVSLLGVQDRLAQLAAHLGPGRDTLFVVDRELAILVHGDPARLLDSAADQGALAGVDPSSIRWSRAPASSRTPRRARWSARSSGYPGGPGRPSPSCRARSPMPRSFAWSGWSSVACSRRCCSPACSACSARRG